MRRFNLCILAAFAFLFIVTSCQNNNDEPTVVPNASLEGDWVVTSRIIKTNYPDASVSIGKANDKIVNSDFADDLAKYEIEKAFVAADDGSTVTTKAVNRSNGDLKRSERLDYKVVADTIIVDEFRIVKNEQGKDVVVSREMRYGYAIKANILTMTCNILHIDVKHYINEETGLSNIEAPTDMKGTLVVKAYKKK